MLPALQITEVLVGSRLIGGAGLGNRMKRAEIDDLTVDTNTRKVWFSVFFSSYPYSSLNAFSAGFIRRMHFPVFPVLIQTRETKVAPSVVVNDSVDVIAQLSCSEITSDHSGQNDSAQVLPFPSLVAARRRSNLSSDVSFLVIKPTRKIKDIKVDVVDDNGQRLASFPRHMSPSESWHTCIATKEVCHRLCL